MIRKSASPGPGHYETGHTDIAVKSNIAAANKQASAVQDVPDLKHTLEPVAAH